MNRTNRTRMSMFLTMLLPAVLMGEQPAISSPSLGADDGIASAGLAVAVQDERTEEAGTTSTRGQDDHAQSRGAVNIPTDRLNWHVPELALAREMAQSALLRAGEESDKAITDYANLVIDRIDTITRPEQVHLTLEDTIRRALANNFFIQILSYNPAIEQMKVVEAQAAFDALFFTNITKNNVDRPTGSQLMATDLDRFTLSSGVRKLLPSGMQVSGSYNLQRTKQAFAFQEINPEYLSQFIAEMRQPVLRNFGIDHNRSMILVAKNNRQISDLAFRRQIRDILRQVEELYWRLVQTRRDVVVTARLLADFEGIYNYLVARREFDITPVQIAATKADLEQARADFVQRRANVFDAQDQLIALMNDPEINLADTIELIPEDFPGFEGFIVDQLAEVQIALDNRTEINESKLQVANAKIVVARAENAELPRFDLIFRTTFDGLAGTADRSFDELSRRKFIEYYIGVEFEVPIGNRGPRAVRRRAELQYDSATAQLRQKFEEIILDVNLAVRKLETTYDQIGPSFESAEAREREVSSLVARAERKDHNTLVNELNSRQRLANIRRTMLNAMVEYNIAIVDLERAKGTLLEYNNIVIPTEID